jgi:hypothetical protein
MPELFTKLTGSVESGSIVLNSYFFRNEEKLILYSGTYQFLARFQGKAAKMCHLIFPCPPHCPHQKTRQVFSSNFTMVTIYDKFCRPLPGFVEIEKYKRQGGTFCIDVASCRLFTLDSR